MPLSREEAESMIDAIKRIDGGCPYCVEEMCFRMSKLDLGWEWTMMDEDDSDGHPVIVVTEKPKSNEGK